MDTLGLLKLSNVDVNEAENKEIINILSANRTKNFVDRILSPQNYPQISNKDGSYSTHLMASGEMNGKHYVFPMITYKDGKLKKWDNWKDALDYAIKNNEFIDFETPEEAEWFGVKYKSGMPKIQK